MYREIFEGLPSGKRATYPRLIIYRACLNCCCRRSRSGSSALRLNSLTDLGISISGRISVLKDARNALALCKIGLHSGTLDVERNGKNKRKRYEDNYYLTCGYFRRHYPGCRRWACPPKPGAGGFIHQRRRHNAERQRHAGRAIPINRRWQRNPDSQGLSGTAHHAQRIPGRRVVGRFWQFGRAPRRG